MSYTIYHADGTPITVPDNAIDTVYYNANVHGPGVGVGTQLVGRNAINYGAPIAQNFLQMTENFASSALYMPGDAFALQGQLWFETTSASDGVLHVRISNSGTGGAANWEAVVTAAPSTGIISNRGGDVPVVNPASLSVQDGDIQVIGSAISIYANSAWHATGASTTNGPTPPPSPVLGQLWYDTTTGLLKVYTTSGFVEVNTGGGETTNGPTPPSSPILGELWYDTSTNTLKAFTTSGWVIVNTGVQSATAIVSATAPTSPVNGLLWFNTTTSILNIYVSPSWIGISGGGTYAGTTPPPSPTAGTFWYDTTTPPGTLKVYTGTAWTPVNTGGVAPPINSSTAPTSPSLGQLWYDTVNSQLKVWNGTIWTEVFVQGGPATPLTRVPITVSNAASFTIPHWVPGTLQMETALLDVSQNLPYNILVVESESNLLVTAGQWLTPTNYPGPPIEVDYILPGQVVGTCNPATGAISMQTTAFTGNFLQWASTGSSFNTNSESVRFINGPYAYTLLPA